MTAHGAFSKAGDSLIAAKANVSEANVKARSAGRSHNPRIIESRLQGYLL